MNRADGIDVTAASSVDDELIAAFNRLIPQLSRSAEVPTGDLIREIVETRATTLLLARDRRDHGRIVGMLTLVVFRIPTGVRTVELTSRPSREAANRLYQRLGFVRRDSNVYRYSP